MEGGVSFQGSGLEGFLVLGVQMECSSFQGSRLEGFLISGVQIGKVPLYRILSTDGCVPATQLLVI